MVVVPKSVIPIRDEAEDIVGHAKMCLHFAKDVYYIVDPDTSDDTVAILEERFPQVHVEYQIKRLGESEDFDALYKEELLGDDPDAWRAGHVNPGEGKLWFHYNMEYWINKLVAPCEWWFFSAPDERLAPKDWAEAALWVTYAKIYGYHSVHFQTHLPAETNGDKYSFCIRPNEVFHVAPHFLKRPKEGFFKGKGAHTGHWLPPEKLRLYTNLPYWHFAYVKDTREAFSGPRDMAWLKDLPRYPWYNPMGDGWKDLPMVDDKGNIKCDKCFPPASEVAWDCYQQEVERGKKRAELEEAKKALFEAKMSQLTYEARLKRLEQEIEQE